VTFPPRLPKPALGIFEPRTHATHHPNCPDSDEDFVVYMWVVVSTSRDHSIPTRRIVSHAEVKRQKSPSAASRILNTSQMRFSLLRYRSNSYVLRYVVSNEFFLVLVSKSSIRASEHIECCRLSRNQISACKVTLRKTSIM